MTVSAAVSARPFLNTVPVPTELPPSNRPDARSEAMYCAHRLPSVAMAVSTASSCMNKMNSVMS